MTCSVQSIPGPAVLCAYMCSPAKVPCKSVVKTARNIIEDVGVEAAAKSGGLKRLAGCSLGNAARDSHTLVGKKLKLALPIPLHTLGSSADGLNFPVLRLRDWAAYLLEHQLWHRLCGLVRRDEERERAILTHFWDMFKQLYPSHTIFERKLDFSRCCPCLFHGDEGRGRRRQGWLASNWHSVLGRGIRSALERESNEKIVGKYLKLKCNYAGSTLTTRYGHASLPKAIYSDPFIFDKVMEHSVEESLFMVTEGVVQERTGTRYFMATLNVVGDWSWIHKCGHLSRSYNNMIKRDVAPGRGKDPTGCADFPSKAQV